MPPCSSYLGRLGRQGSRSLDCNQTVRLKTYTAEPIKVWGEFTAEVQYGEQKNMCSVIVVDGQGPSLLGKDWLAKFNFEVGSCVANMCRECDMG